MTAVAAIRRALFSFTLLAVIPWQAAADTTQGTPAMGPPTNEELSTSLIFNQLAILEMMHNFGNESRVAAEMRIESDANRDAARRMEETMSTRVDRMEEALGTSVERMLEALEVQQRHMQQVINSLTTTAAEDTHTRAIVHDDYITSLCIGHKFLHGTLGSLEVVNSNTYTSNNRCSWNLTFPVESSVTLTWNYIDLEDHSSCLYDYVEVTSNSQSVYGRKLCGNLSSSILELLNLTVHGTRSLLVSFKSDGSTEKRGFRMMYRAH